LRPCFAQRFAARQPPDDTASRRQHDVRPLRQLVDQRLLAVAKRLLALDLEDRRDRHAGATLELDVGVDELEREPPRDLPAERRLARTHHADEEEVAAVQRHSRIIA
jgi:hypothetical protein